MFTETNKHGVVVHTGYNTGHYGHEVNGIFRHHLPVSVPHCCTLCKHFGDAEFDGNECIGGPYCGVNLRFPTRKGTCKRFLSKKMEQK